MNLHNSYNGYDLVINHAWTCSPVMTGSEGDRRLWLLITEDHLAGFFAMYSHSDQCVGGSGCLQSSQRAGGGTAPGSVGMRVTMKAMTSESRHS